MHRILFFILLTSQFAIAQGLLPVNPGEKWGYINLEGEMVIEPQFSFAGTFHDSRAVVRDSGYYYLIETTGEQIGELLFEDVTWRYNLGLRVVINGEELVLSWNELSNLTSNDILDSSYQFELGQQGELRRVDLGQGLVFVGEGEYLFSDYRGKQLVDEHGKILASGLLEAYRLHDSILCILNMREGGNIFFSEGEVIHSSRTELNWGAYYYSQNRILSGHLNSMEADFLPLGYADIEWLGYGDSISQEQYWQDRLGLTVGDNNKLLFLSPLRRRTSKFSGYQMATFKIGKSRPDFYKRWDWLENVRVGVVSAKGREVLFPETFDNISVWKGHHCLVRIANDMDTLDRFGSRLVEKWILVDSLGNQIGNDTILKPRVRRKDGWSDNVSTPTYTYSIPYFDRDSSKYYTYNSWGQRDYESPKALTYNSIRENIPSPLRHDGQAERQRLHNLGYEAKFYLGYTNNRYRRIGSLSVRQLGATVLWDSLNSSSLWGYERIGEPDWCVTNYTVYGSDSDFVYFFDSGNSILLSNDEYLSTSILDISAEVVFVNYLSTWGYITSTEKRLAFDFHHSSFVGYEPGFLPNGPGFYVNEFNRERRYTGDHFTYYSIPFFRPRGVQLELDWTDWDSQYEWSIINDSGGELSRMKAHIELFHRGSWMRVGKWQFDNPVKNHHIYPVGTIQTNNGDIPSTMRIVLEYEYDRDGEVVNGMSISEEVPCTYNAYHVSKANR
ncbi:WG repeat-containing protein [Phaeocystidibacter marisrubri]|nr:WG repeat-containing protein [Phaeocystidibacter marisrubri]